MRESTLRKRQSLANALRDDPVVHIENIQGIDSLEEYQKEIARAVYKYDQVAIRACHDVGKTFTMGKVFAAIMSTFPGAIGITTAPTYRQVEKLLWGEIRKSAKRSLYPLGGKIYDSKPEWFFDDDWYALGFTPKKEAGHELDEEQKGSSFQGFHGKYVIIVFDEATGIPKQIWDAAEGMRTSANVKFVCIGNPTTRNSEFYKCFNGKKSRFWKGIHISCFDSPNLKANGVTSLKKLSQEVEKVKKLNIDQYTKHVRSYDVVNPYLITLKWVVEMAIAWDFDHPLFLSKVLGEFPKKDSQALFDLQAIIDAQQREKSEAEPSIRLWGIDPARYGEDKTIITVIEDWDVVDRFSITKKDGPFVVNEIVQRTRKKERAEREIIGIDAIGVGSSAYDHLLIKQESGILSPSIEVYEINASQAPWFKGESKAIQRKNNSHYLNLKSRMFQVLANDLRDKLTLLDHEIYQEEMPTIRYEFLRGKMKIESKDDYKKRTGRTSPDTTDSLAIANICRYIPSTQDGEVWAA